VFEGVNGRGPEGAEPVFSFFPSTHPPSFRMFGGW
jgi:hypothetical protein